jgi:hypothetical protein
VPTRTEVTQCKSCPWRVDCVPDRDIPNGYCANMHAELKGTIRSGLESLQGDVIRSMACHYSKIGEEFHCAGWLHNQLGSGNNIAVRIGVMSGRIPVPVVDGPQHETFEETLPRKEKHVPRRNHRNRRGRNLR